MVYFKFASNNLINEMIDSAHDKLDISAYKQEMRYV